MFNYIYSLPLLLIVLIILGSIFLWTVICKYSKIANKLNIILFVVSLVAILYTTLLRRSIGLYDVILKPFYTFELAKIQPEFYREMLMNVFLFVPLGLSLPYVLSIKQGKYVIIKSIVIGLLLSIIIEYCQYYFCIGTCEVDDVIMNTFGLFIGSVSFILYKKK